MTREILMQNFGYTHYVLNANVEGITHEESLKPSAAGANGMNWIVGHLLRSRNGIHALLGMEPAIEDGLMARYKQRTAPIDGDGEGVLPFAQLTSAIDASQNALMARLEKVSNDELAAACPHVLQKGQQSTVAVQLAGLNFHEGYHAGQTGIVRRILGKEGKLAGPEE